MKDPNLQVILKYINYPSIVAILTKCKNKDNFNFVENDKK